MTSILVQRAGRGARPTDWLQEAELQRGEVGQVGEDLAEHYVIDGMKNEKKRILLDRGLVMRE